MNQKTSKQSEFDPLKKSARAGLGKAPLKKGRLGTIIGIVLVCVIAVGGLLFSEETSNGHSGAAEETGFTSHSSSSSASSPGISHTPGSGAPDVEASALSDVPGYDGEAYVELNGGKPSFTAEELAMPDGTEIYGELDSLGRATYAFAKLCANTRPKAGSTRDTKMPNPSGWVQAFYPDVETGEDEHLYERTHLIAYSLNDEATNPRDLITGTEYLNQYTMTPFETAIRNCIGEVDRATGHKNHVLMRVTPDFRGDELVARGVQIEALSVEDGGDSICLNVYCYNVEPGIVIDYATGKSHLE